ncbi:MAG: hypothetical protein COZ21_02125, partial [Bacteroidetes bacterium CG_4_10_14_3_um_filter_31_20]
MKNITKIKYFIKYFYLFIFIFYTSCTHNTDNVNNTNNYDGILQVNKYFNFILIFSHSSNDVVSFHIIPQIYNVLVKYNAY